MQQEIVDRIAASMRESALPLDAGTIAHDFLKLTQTRSPATRLLIRAMLSKDGRFEELSEGQWGLSCEHSARGPVIGPPVAVCALEVVRGVSRSPWLWRIHATLWNQPTAVLSHHGCEWSADLEVLLGWLRTHPVACDRPGLLSRWIGAQERIHALSEVQLLIIDLRIWRRLLEVESAAQAHSVSANTTPESVAPETLLAPLCETLDQVVEAARKRDLRSWQDVARVQEGASQEARQRVWSQERAFTAAEVDALPEEPGIYRFLSKEGGILYVGKAKNLRTRVSTYFRPLEDGSSRRAEFLRQIHHLETETTGTELAALIRESAQISRHRPPWNVQVQIEAEQSEFSVGEQDLLLLLPRSPGSFSLFALNGHRAAVGAIDRTIDSAALLAALRRFYVEGNGTGDLTEIPAPERVLVRRWLRWSRGDCAVFSLADFTTYAALVEAIGRVTVAGDEPSAWRLPLIVREGPHG